MECKGRSKNHHHQFIFRNIREQLLYMRQQRKATRGAIRLNELVGNAGQGGTAGLFMSKKRGGTAGASDTRVVTIAGLMCMGLRDQQSIITVNLCFYLPFKVLFNVLMSCCLSFTFVHCLI